MPAVDVEDRLALPRIVRPGGPGVVDRPVVSVTTAPKGFEGEGFPVHRAFAGVPHHVLDPFVHMDQMGEVDYAPGEPKGTPGIPTGGSRPSRTSSTAPSAIRTRQAVAASSPMGTPSG